MDGVLLEGTVVKANISNFRLIPGRKIHDHGAVVGKESDAVTFSTDKMIATKPFTDYSVKLKNGTTYSISISNISNGKNVTALVNAGDPFGDE